MAGPSPRHSAVTREVRCRMPRRGIQRITWTTIMTLEQPRIFIAVAERQRVTQMAKVLKERPKPRANGRARTAHENVRCFRGQGRRSLTRGLLRRTASVVTSPRAFANMAEAHFAGPHNALRQPAPVKCSQIRFATESVTAL